MDFEVLISGMFVLIEVRLFHTLTLAIRILIQSFY
jgi:hypothetical protein